MGLHEVVYFHVFVGSSRPVVEIPFRCNQFIFSLRLFFSMSYSVFVTPDYLLSAKINEDGDPETILSRENDKAAACSKPLGKPLEVCKFSKHSKLHFYYSPLLLGLDNLPQGYHNPFNREVGNCLVGKEFLFSKMRRVLVTGCITR